MDDTKPTSEHDNFLASLSMDDDEDFELDRLTLCLEFRSSEEYHRHMRDLWTVPASVR